MAIECYEDRCPYHCIHSGEEGPYCFEEECKNPNYEPEVLPVIDDEE